VHEKASVGVKECDRRQEKKAVSKLVVLRFGTGSLTTGFSVILQIGEENARPTSEVAGALPPNLELLTQFQHWQTLYRSLDFAGRPMGIAKTPFPSSAAACRQAGEDLGDRLNHWLQSASFRPIREKWLEKLQPQDVIRMIIQTEDLHLPKLPWHLWEMFDRYFKAEIGLAESGYEQVNPPVPVSWAGNNIEPTPVKVLALLGDSTGIQLQADRQQLEQLPHAAVTFLVEPALQDLTDRLWEQHWDILFFAGHSSTQAQSGRIFINATESLTMAQLRYALRKAVDGGMKLAIFNSCDGLGMAHELADLQIPQVIVMREPVPDRVAQEFLKYFLQAYAQGETLYLSVRQARERLQGLENQFPCASWLPVMFQNLAEVTPTWQGLAGIAGDVRQQGQPQQRPPQQPLRKIGKILAATMTIAAVVTGVRSLGVLQPLELQAYDQLLQLRPAERPDNRLLVVSITEEDVQAQAKEQRQGSLSDISLDKLLEKLEAAQPLAIGLDIYRDHPVQNLPRLAARLRQSDRLVGICKVSDPQANRAGISPPPEIPGDRLGFSDLIPDADNVIRRQLLALTPPPNSSCTASYAFSVQMALRYLSTRNIALKFAPDDTWLLGKLRLQPLESHSGGYQGIDAWGHQILLNYRKVPTGIAPTVTLSQVLNNQFDVNAVKDKIVLIGTTAESFQDYSLTPYQNQQGQNQQGRVQKIPGVMLQAQQISQILSAALEGRSLIWTAAFWQETLWVLLWSITGGLLAGWVQRSPYLGLSSAVAIALLYSLCWLILAQWAGWIPLIPAAIALLASITTVRLFKIQNP
jgi:CHASE2 domain-containing sensor protein